MLRLIENNRLLLGSVFLGAGLSFAAVGTIDTEARYEQRQLQQPLDASHHEHKPPPVERYEPSETDDKDAMYVYQIPHALVRGRDYPVNQ